MSKNMFTLYYDEPKSIELFRILQKNKKVKCLDWVSIEKDITNETIGRLFFIEGPTIFVNTLCWLSGKVIKNGVTAYVKTKNDKIIEEESQK